MSQQTWPLSQDANKSSGLCSVCRATRQLHLKDGTLHRHGPRDNPCPGSNKLPLSILQNLPGPSGQSQPSVSASGSQPVPPAQSSSNTQSVSWSPPSSPLIKHIPKSARPACASHLAKLLRAVIAQQGISKNWLAVIKLGFLHSRCPQTGWQTTQYNIRYQKADCLLSQLCCSRSSHFYQVPQ